MTDFSINSISNLYDQNNLGIFSLFVNHSNDSSFSQAVTRDSDFAKMLLAQIQNESLKMLGNYNGEQQDNDITSVNNSINSLFTDNSSTGGLQTASTFLGTSSDTTESEDIFTEQMVSLIKLNQIKVFQGLVGKSVKARTREGQEVTGVVESIALENNLFVFTVAGQKVSPESITEVLG